MISINCSEGDLHQGMWAGAIRESGEHLARVIRDLAADDEIVIDSLELGPLKGTKNTIFKEGAAQITTDLDYETLQGRLYEIAESYGLTHLEAQEFISVQTVSDRTEYRDRFNFVDDEGIPRTYKDHALATSALSLRTVDGQDSDRLVEGLRASMGNFELLDAVALPTAADMGSAAVRQVMDSIEEVTGQRPSVDNCGGTIGALGSLPNPLVLGFYEDTPKSPCGMHGDLERFEKQLYGQMIGVMAHTIGHTRAPE